MNALDPRINAYRPDLADCLLEGQVQAARFVEGKFLRIGANVAPLKGVPRPDAPLDSELLRGEVIRVFETTAEGWSWVQNQTNSYVGYVPTEAISDRTPESTHCVSVLRTFIYPGPDMKLPVVGWLSLASEIAVDGEAETRGTRFLLLAGGEGAVLANHLISLDDPYEGDLVSVAERFVETPYLWGGRTSLGLDCSALLQLSLMRYGVSWHRDTDLQQRTLGLPVEGGLEAELDRGDLAFWNGHVGILVDGANLIHASGHHMRVVIEPLTDAVGRMGPPIEIRRFNDRGRIGTRAAGREFRIPGA